VTPAGVAVSQVSPVPKRELARRRTEKLCLALPEATCERCGSHATFRVRNKVFAYYLDDHHGDGIVGLCAKLPLGQHEELIRQDPARFYMPAYIGPRGWVGLRLDRRSVDWREADALIRTSYAATAPARLLKALDATASRRRGALVRSGAGRPT
jgi:hypothetical protein